MSSATTPVDVGGVAVPTTITVGVSNPNPVAGETITISGYLKDVNGNAVNGRIVDIRPEGQYGPGMGEYTDGNGHYERDWLYGQSGSFDCFVEFQGDASYEGCPGKIPIRADENELMEMEL